MVHSLIFLTACLLVAVAHASHYRGGIVYCDPKLEGTDGGFIGEDKIQIECTYRVAWRLSWSMGTHCDHSRVTNKVLLEGPNNRMKCTEGCGDDKFIPISFYCTDFSPHHHEDWTEGSRSFLYNITGTPHRFTGTMSGCCWINSLVRFGGQFSWLTSLNLTRRADTKRINFSPRSELNPMVSVKYGCGQNLSILTEDPDNDIVKCRWALKSNANNHNECGDVCPPLHGATLDEESCTLHVPHALEPGLHAVTIVLEDYARSHPTGKPLSQVPFQFLIKVYESRMPCTFRPVLMSPSPGDNMCIPVAADTEYQTTIRAKQTSVTNVITRFHMTKPAGMQRGPITRYTGSGTDAGQVQVSWRPTPSQYGYNVFCFSASDTLRQRSSQRCIILLAGASSPEIVAGSMTPGAASGKRPQRQDAVFTVDFDQEIRKPSEAASIRVYNVTGASPVEVYAVDASSSPHVFIHRHPTIARRYQLGFRVTTRLQGQMQYAITLDAGIVIGSRSCNSGGTPYNGMSDMGSWRFQANYTVQCEGTYPEDHTLHRADDATRNISADTLFIVDESRNMRRGHDWLRENTRALDAALRRKGLGVTPGNPNMYAVVGYARSHSEVFPHRYNTTGGRGLFGIDDFASVAAQVDTEGGSLEDGYLAITYALKNVPLRPTPNVRTNIILLTDEDRDTSDAGQDITRRLTKRVIKRSLGKGAQLTTLADHRFLCTQNNLDAIGYTHQRKGIRAGGAGGFSDCGNARVSHDFGHTNLDYTSMTKELKGSSWNIEELRNAAQSVKQSFSTAFNEVNSDYMLQHFITCRDCTCLDDGEGGQFSCPRATNQDECKCLAESSRNTFVSGQCRPFAGSG